MDELAVYVQCFDGQISSVSQECKTRGLGQENGELLDAYDSCESFASDYGINGTKCDELIASRTACSNTACGDEYDAIFLCSQGASHTQCQGQQICNNGTDATF